MNRFLYFLPNLGGCNPEMLRARGLINRFEAPGGQLLEHGVTGWLEGPGGVAGACITLGSEPTQYDPAAQLWQDCGAFWLGVTAGAQPGPDELERDLGLTGYIIRLADGNEWRVPLLRKWNEDEHVSALPKVFRLIKNEAGRVDLKQVCAAQYEPLDQLAESILTAFYAAEKWSIEALFGAAVALLRENYRIGAEEMSLLGLFDADLALQALQLSIDYPKLAAAAEAFALDGLSAKEVPDAV